MRPESAGLDSGSVLQDRRALNESPVRHVRPESAGLDSGLASQTSVCASAAAVAPVAAPPAARQRVGVEVVDCRTAVEL